ncbi:MAG: acylphosphatase [Dehalococcoidia bacterium]|nr:acylphosphatase [Dehalococcoidia bacterium]
MVGENVQETARLRVLVMGRVQGVSFRYYARRQALGLGLVGWARNLRDGATVEVVAEGPRPALAHFLQLLQAGSRRASVAQVEVEWSEAEGKFQSFQIS